MCTDDDMPSQDTIYRWVLNNPEFSERYAEARDIGLDIMADDLLDIADDGSNDWTERFDRDGNSIGWKVNGEAILRSRLRVDTRKWYLSKLAPKRYGDRIEHVGANGLPLIANDPLDIARRVIYALERAVAAIEPPIDGEATREA